MNLYFGAWLEIEKWVLRLIDNMLLDFNIRVTGRYMWLIFIVPSGDW